VKLDTTRLTEGAHHVVVSVIDAAGNSATVLDREITVANPPQACEPGAPAGVSASAIRYYESVGLVEPEGRNGGRRVYGELAVERLAPLFVPRETALVVVRQFVAEAKQDAWDVLVSGEQALATFWATLSGFADPDQPELVNPYREKYFAVVADAWRTWSSAMAQDFVSGVYTVCAVSDETVRLTDEYIAASDPPAALRRLLLEGRDDVLRALRCQAKDGQARDRQAS